MQCLTFSGRDVLFVYVFCWNIEYILGNMSQEVFEKFYIQFSNNTFPTFTVITNSNNYAWKFDLFIKMLNFDDRFEI